MNKLLYAIAGLALSTSAMAQSPSPSPTPPPAPFAQVVTPEELALNSRIMEIAKSYLGLENATGDERDPDRVVPNAKIQELAHYIFHSDVPSEEFMGGWCDWFVTAVAMKAGVTGVTQSMLGVLLLDHGHFVTSPIPGDVVLLDGHIAFFAAEDPSADYIWVLGGNQEYARSMSQSGGGSSSGGGSYYYYNSEHKKTPFLVHGLPNESKGNDANGSVNQSDQDVTVHIPAPKIEKRGFGVNYAKIPRSAVQMIFRFNP